ncbi:MAG TPA: hypothetical protein VFB00_08540 [Terriglobales bacterium]|nr:hypothetical protein [Terriglobales bacterium]
MSRMLELIRASALPFHQMTSASKGALRLPPEEMVEILVYLAEHNKIFGETARLTLAGWDEASAKTIVANPHTPKEVLTYWLSPKNIRPALFPLLLENPSVLNSELSELAKQLKGELVNMMIASPRVRGSMQLLQDLARNHQLTGAQAARVQALLAGKSEPAGAEEINPESVAAAATGKIAETPVSQQAPEPAPEAAADQTASDPNPPGDQETEDALAAFFVEHAKEIAAEADKLFQPIGGIYEEEAAKEEPKAVAAAASAQPAAKPQPVAHKTLVAHHGEDDRRGSVLQKIAKLDVKGRIHLAMRGNKEERSILVRDGTKIVALAVLDSPKITDGEVEKFATQKNVLEAVLRAIPMKRRFAKNYAIMRNLVFNPRTPLDVSLSLMKNLLVADLKNLTGNKEVSDTIRKLALRMFKQKMEPAKKN